MLARVLVHSDWSVPGADLSASSLTICPICPSFSTGEAKAGDCICLHGPVGAGKSTFRHALACPPPLFSPLPISATDAIQAACD